MSMQQEAEVLPSGVRLANSGRFRTWIDCSDVIHFALAGNRTVTGIQRVVINLYREFDAAGEAPGLVCNGPNGLAIVEVSRSGAVALFDALISGKASPREIRSLAMATTAQAKPWEPVAADTLLLPGAFWIHDPTILIDIQNRPGLRIVPFVHDVLIWRHPEFFPMADRPIFLQAFLHLAAISSAILTSSRYVAEEVRACCEAHSIASPPVLPIGMANASLSAPPQATPELLERLADRPFALCVGTIEIRKNHKLLLDVWDRLYARHGEATPVLVFAGKRGWMVDGLFAEIADRPWCATHLLLTGSLDEAALAWLYTQCRFTLYPSQAEGWGLPIGESLAAGVPCAAAGATALPEAGGEFVAYFDPTSVTSATHAVERLLDDAERDRWQARIRAQFQPLGWDQWTRTCGDALARVTLRRRLPPFLRKGQVHVFAGHDRWGEKQPRVTTLMLCSGWRMLDGDGAVTDGTATLRALLEPGSTDSTTLTVLVSSEQAGSPPLVRAGGEPFHCLSMPARNRWLLQGSFDNVAGHLLELSLEPAHEGQTIVLHALAATDTPVLSRACLRTMLKSRRDWRVCSRVTSIKSIGKSPRLLVRLRSAVDLQRARNAARAGAWEAAVRHYVNLCRLQGATAAHWTQYGHACKETGDYTTAREAYREALALGGDAVTRFHFNAVSAMLAAEGEQKPA
jgi:glycosyltransferase involved in cell wall biosynthesis